MKKKMLALLLACLCLSLAACAKTEVPAAEAPTQTQPAETPAAPAQTEETPTEETPAAKEAPALSGKVTVYMPSPAGLADKLAALFTEKTGVEVEQFQGTTGEILARLEAEQVNPVADVVILASWSDGLSMKADDKLESYIDEAFFLGGVSKRDVLSAFGAHIFFDDKHVHADPASEVVPSAVVPYREGDNPEK